MNPELLTRCSIDEQPTQVIAASEAKLSLTFPPVRFVCKADELAFPGTEAISAG